MIDIFSLERSEREGGDWKRETKREIAGERRKRNWRRRRWRRRKKKVGGNKGKEERGVLLVPRLSIEAISVMRRCKERGRGRENGERERGREREREIN